MTRGYAKQSTLRISAAAAGIRGGTFYKFPNPKRQAPAGLSGGAPFRRLLVADVGMLETNCVPNSQSIIARLLEAHLQSLATPA